MIAVRLNVTRHISNCLEHVSGKANAPVTNTLHAPHSTFFGKLSALCTFVYTHTDYQ